MPDETLIVVAHHQLENPNFKLRSTLVCEAWEARPLSTSSLSNSYPPSIFPSPTSTFRFLLLSVTCPLQYSADVSLSGSITLHKHTRMSIGDRERVFTCLVYTDMSIDGSDGRCRPSLGRGASTQRSPRQEDRPIRKAQAAFSGAEAARQPLPSWAAEYAPVRRQLQACEHELHPSPLFRGCRQAFAYR